MQENVREALQIATTFGQIDGDHHKTWVIDQMVRKLLGEEDYMRFRQACSDWDEGIAP